jgi:hypothetical protein
MDTTQNFRLTLTPEQKEQIRQATLETISRNNFQ